MKIFGTLLLIFLLLTTQVTLAQKTKSNTKTTSKSIPSNNKSKEVTATKKETLPSKKNNETKNSAQSTKGCSSCPGFEGIVLSTNSNGNFSFDSIAKSYNSNVNTELVGGIWKYTNTILINKKGELVKILRAYYNDLDQSLYNLNTKPASADPQPGDQDIMNDPAQKMKKENERLGRDKFNPSDNLLVFDPNVDYLFLDKPGNTEDSYVIRKKRPDNTIIQLTNADIRFKFENNAKTNQVLFILQEHDEPISKEFVVLKLNNDSFIIADYSFKEIHFFDRTGIHKE